MSVNPLNSSTQSPDSSQFPDSIQPSDSSQPASSASEQLQGDLTGPWDDTFSISPLIRLTLNSLYGALLLPLPLLAYKTNAPVHPGLISVGIVLGWLGLYAALTERVLVNAQGIRVAYSAWVPPLWRKGWSLEWSQVKALKPRSTGQGGLVYYFLSKQDKAFLLPMRMAGFARFVRYVQAHTGIDTTDVRPLSQPWMYIILLGLTVFLWLTDGWTLITLLSQGTPSYGL